MVLMFLMRLWLEATSSVDTTHSRNSRNTINTSSQFPTPILTQRNSMGSSLDLRMLTGHGVEEGQGWPKHLVWARQSVIQLNETYCLDMLVGDTCHGNNYLHCNYHTDVTLSNLFDTMLFVLFFPLDSFSFLHLSFIFLVIETQKYETINMDILYK